MAGEVKNRVSEIGDRPFAATFGVVFFILGKILLYGFFAFIIAFIVVFIIAAFSGGNSSFALVDYVYGATIDPLMNSGFGNFIQKAVSYLGVVTPGGQAEILKDLEGSKWETHVSKNTNKDLGVKLDYFEAERNIIPLDYAQDMEVNAEGSILSLEGTNVQFSCLADGEMVQENIEEIYAYPDIEEFFKVKCIYDKEDFKIDESKDSYSGKAQLKVSYDFLTEASLIIYTLEKEIKDEMNTNDVDIFEGVNNPYLDDRRTSSVYTEGPIKLGLRVSNTQPLVEVEEYSMTLKMDDDIKWTGGIEDIESIELLLSPGLVLTDNRFEDVGVEDSLIVYRAKEIFIENLQDLCATDEVSIGEGCWRSGNLEDDVSFSVKEVSEDLTEELIKAKIRYRFGDIKQDTITFLNV